MTKAVFLDRDGVINRKPEEGRYVTRWEEFRFLPDVARAISTLKAAGYLAIVVTNQRCVAKELMSIDDLHALHQRMMNALSASGAEIDAIYYCPHEKDVCDCRKPAPGMLLAAATKHAINLQDSWMIGDSEIDIEAGKRAGCRTALVSEGRGMQAGQSVTASSLLAAAQQILHYEAEAVQPAAALGKRVQ